MTIKRKRIRAAPETSLLLSLVVGTVVLAEPSPATAQELTLADVVTSTLQTHPTLQSAGARAEAAREAASGARATRLPGLALEGSVTRFQEPMIVAPLHGFDPMAPPRFDEALVQARLSARYTVFDAARSARIRAGSLLASAASEAQASSRMQVLAEAVTAYSALHAARTVRGAADAQVGALRAELARVEQSLEAGTAARVELLRAEAALQEAIAESVTAETRVGLAERALARTSGLPATRIASSPVAELQLTSSAGTERIASSPRVARAARVAEAAEARFAEERGGRLPRLDLTAGFVDFGTLSGGHTAEWQAGVQLSWPLFTGGARAALVRGARAEARAADGELEVTRLRVAEELDRAEASSAEAAARAAALEAAVAQWTEVARIERLALDSGSGTQADLLRAEASRFRAEAALAQARHDGVVAQTAAAEARGVLDEAWIAQTLERGR